MPDSPLTPDRLLYAYSVGAFPMAPSGDSDRIYWFSPEHRGIIPLDDRFHVSKNLRKLVRREPFHVTADEAFGAVIRACAERDETWISDPITEAYEELHRRGHAHSLECWDRSDGRLVGGLYGVALGGAFFGESMFHRVTDASKVALVHLVERLRKGGFRLLDTQYLTSHLEQFGAYEVRRVRYHRLLERALAVDADWNALERPRWRGEAERPSTDAPPRWDDASHASSDPASPQWS